MHLLILFILFISSYLFILFIFIYRYVSFNVYQFPCAKSLGRILQSSGVQDRLFHKALAGVRFISEASLIILMVVWSLFCILIPQKTLIRTQLISFFWTLETDNQRGGSARENRSLSVIQKSWKGERTYWILLDSSTAAERARERAWIAHESIPAKSGYTSFLFLASNVGFIDVTCFKCSYSSTVSLAFSWMT